MQVINTDEERAAELRQQRLAVIAAAQAGDWKPANDMELAFINASTDICWLANQSGEVQLGHEFDEWNIEAVRLHRGYGPRGELGVEWEVFDVCGFCLGEKEVEQRTVLKSAAGAERPTGDVVEVDCPDCDGTGRRAAPKDRVQHFFTDVDGRTIPQREPCEVGALL